MTIELKKTIANQQQKYRGNASKSYNRNSFNNRYWFTLPDEVINLLGRNIIIQRHPITREIVLSRPNLNSRRNPVKICQRNTIRVPSEIIDEWQDLGTYEIDIDHESEEVNLIKK